MQIEAIREAMEVLAQEPGHHGRVWRVSIETDTNGPINVRVAAETPATLLARLWDGQLTGKKPETAISRLFRDQLELLDHISAVTPSRRFVLRSKNWTRYVVEVYCCEGRQVEVVAVSERQMKMALYYNWGNALPFAPVDDRVSWESFRPIVISKGQGPAVTTTASVTMLPAPPTSKTEKPKSLKFEGILCPACGCHNETSRHRCRECNDFLRKDTRSTHRVRAGQPTEPVLIAL